MKNTQAVLKSGLWGFATGIAVYIIATIIYGNISADLLLVIVLGITALFVIFSFIQERGSQAAIPGSDSNISSMELAAVTILSLALPLISGLAFWAVWRTAYPTKARIALGLSLGVLLVEGFLFIYVGCNHFFPCF
jgi:hypothetical protein